MALCFSTNMTKMNKLLKIHNHNRSNRYLPEEIVLKILLFIDAGNLANCKSVSKLWYSLVTNPSFWRTHYSLQKELEPNQVLFTSVHKLTDHISHYYHFSVDARHDAPPKQLELQVPIQVLLQQKGYSSAPETTTLSPKKLGLSLYLKAACNGLLLFQDVYNARQMYISNPVTGYFKALPRVLSSTDQCFHWVLVHDTQTDNYKVFGVMPPYELMMLILGGLGMRASTVTFCRKWLSSGVLEPRIPHIILSQFILIQKELHWLAIDNDPLNNDQAYCYLCRLDVEKLLFSKQKVPLDVLKPCVKLSRGLQLLTELKGGSLCLVAVYHHQLEMLVLEDRLENIWIKTHVLTLSSLTNLPHLVNGFMSDSICLVAMRGGDIGWNLFDLLKVFVHHKGKLCSYDLKTNTLRPIGLLSQKQKLCKAYFFHSNSLVRWD